MEKIFRRTFFFKFIFLLSTISIIDSVSPRINGISYSKLYKCENKKCSRTIYSSNDASPQLSKNVHSTMAACRLSCDINGALWPVPTGIVKLGRSYIGIHPSKFTFDISAVPQPAVKMINEANSIFLKNLERFLGHEKNETDVEDRRVDVFIGVNSSDLDLDWSTDESYSLELKFEYADGVKNGRVDIISNTMYGARHALETLLQLTAPVIKPTGGRGLVILRSASITDAPKFSHRGLLIDTSRNFVPLKDILRTIDGLSACKMNVLHWHATDSQSFPLELKRVPLMTLFGAYGPEKIYTTEDMSFVVNYGRVRGVRVILELDAPSHSGAGWEWGKEAGLGSLAVCVNAQPWRNFCIQPPCGQLNPVNPNVFDVLREIYKDFIEIWGASEVFHMGGDEVFMPCWNATDEITDAMTNRSMGRTQNDFLKLWSEYQESLMRVVDEEREAAGVSKTVDAILWSSELTHPSNINNYVDKNRYVIQTWVESSSSIPFQLLELGYRLIISTKNTWYLDHGVWGNTKFHTWRDVYLNRIPNQPGVLGGEVAMWGEYVDGGSFDPRIWPRTAAAAERLWSDDPYVSTAMAEPRLQGQRDRLSVRDIHSAAIFPEWCAQHDGQCQ